MSKNKSTEKFTLTDPIQFLALGFGSGLAPKAPGTFGTLSAVPIFLLMSALTPLYYAIIVTLMAVAGIYICQKAADAAGVHDHGAIVWDEIVGFLITMFMVPVSWLSILVGFALFRFFDILKPYPINIIDKKMKNGLGIMLDDIIAAIYSTIAGIIIWTLWF